MSDRSKILNPEILLVVLKIVPSLYDVSRPGAALLRTAPCRVVVDPVANAAIGCPSEAKVPDAPDAVQRVPEQLSEERAAKGLTSPSRPKVIPKLRACNW